MAHISAVPPAPSVEPRSILSNASDVAVVPLTPVSSSAAAGTVSSAIVRAHKAVSQCFIFMVCLS